MEVHMKRWHEERDLMMRRWRKELGVHGPDIQHSKWKWGGPHDYVAPPSWAASIACHCAAGIGTMRKNTLGCGTPRCALCHFEKYYVPKRRAAKKREAIEYSML